MPRLLYLSPVMPAPRGNGLAMRAYMVLGLLADRYDVSLAVAPLYGSPGSLSSAVANICRDVVFLPVGRDQPDRVWSWRQLLRRKRADIRKLLADPSFDVVHVFRLAMLPFTRKTVEALPAHGTAWHLDLDDVESVTNARLGALYRSTGKSALGDAADREANRCATLEAEVLGTFDRVYVCSRLDQQRLQGRARAEVRVLPNALPLSSPPHFKPPAMPFTFMFVGTLGYYPNEDAVAYFSSAVLPLLRAVAPVACRLVVIGNGPADVMQRLRAAPEVEVVGPVADVGPWYADADVIVVPVRAGGGTRIKVLEAFAHGRPVVSTSVGIEGIEVQPEEHVLVGDTPDAFARQCVRLMSDATLGHRLAAAAWSLFSGVYTTTAVATSGALA
jgi:glycosyltransferase involved in cell wall biosynthesis